MIVEDDLMIADMIEAALTAHGYVVCGIAPTVAEATALALREKPDLAIIDLRLADGGLGTDIADQLRGRHSLGILYATGNAANVRLTALNGHACISKPYSEAGLLRALVLVAEIIATGKASPPFPKGFQVLAASPVLRRVSNE
ncbi:MAG: response regulator [Rhodospirillaceae bacterium]